MGVQTGIWNFDGKPVDLKLLDDFSQALKQQGPDGEFCHVDGSIALLYRPFHTTAESRLEKQPYVSRRGFVITWDGRLDNREELAIELCDEVTADATDVALFGAAFDRWESECFRRIIGDWAVSIWQRQQRELIFACDFMAIRHIFYYLTNDRIWWSTDLTPLVLLSGDKFHIDDEYIAGYFAHDPEAHLTPYREIRQVPPGQFVRVQNNRRQVERYWRFSPKSRIRYKSDAEYEEHFRYVFRESVRRRLRSDSPILAELSGGLDSSSIVCIADDILAKEGAHAPRLDTLSYQDRTEPNGDDWVYFPKIEAYRKRVGHHIDASLPGTAPTFADCRGFSAFPGYVYAGHSLEAQRAEALRSGGYRATLSGLGGDEFLGGIPDPSPQLADLILQFKLLTLSSQLFAWGLAKRRPWTTLVLEAVINLLPPSIAQPFIPQAQPESWLDPKFVKSMRVASRLIDVDEHFGMWLPSRRSYIAGVVMMSNRVAKWPHLSPEWEEIRFPYLDRNLIEFLLSVPCQQLLRPGERRSLMRRSLSALVPNEILSRRTKQFGARTPITELQGTPDVLEALFKCSISSKLGYIDPAEFAKKLQAARNGSPIHITRMLRTIGLEIWLRQLASRGFLDWAVIEHGSVPNGFEASAPVGNEFHHSC